MEKSDVKPSEEKVTGASVDQNTNIKSTRTSGVLLALISFFILLLILVIFIFENMQRVRLSFLGYHGSVPLALAMLLAAVAGALLIASAALARILQLRRLAKHRAANSK